MCVYMCVCVCLYSLGWPQTHYVAKVNSEPLLPKTWDCKHVTMPSFNDIYTIILANLCPKQLCV